MNCIRCQAPLRRTMDQEAKVPVEACISCRSLWFGKQEIRLALGVKSLGKTGPEDRIEFSCPACPNSDLSNYHIEGVEMPIISCPTCLGAWVDGGKFAKIKASIADAGKQKNMSNPNANPALAMNIPQNIKPQKEVKERDWLTIAASLFLFVGTLAFAFVLLKHFKII